MRAGSEQPGYFALRRYVYFAGGGYAGQPRHGHYITRKNNCKACAGAQAQLAYLYAKAAGAGGKPGVVRQGILRFGYTYGEIAEAEFGKTVYLLFRRRKHGYAVAAVNFFNNGFYLFFYT